MTWLSEIEYTRLLLDRPPKGGWRKEMARMARVIRELVEHIIWLEIRSPTYKDGRQRFSSDVKEIINDTSAPSSN